MTFQKSKSSTRISGYYRWKTASCDNLLHVGTCCHTWQRIMSHRQVCWLCRLSSISFKRHYMLFLRDWHHNIGTKYHIKLSQTHKKNAKLSTTNQRSISGWLGKKWFKEWPWQLNCLKAWSSLCPVHILMTLWFEEQ